MQVTEHFDINVEVVWNDDHTAGNTMTTIICKTCGSTPELWEGFAANEPTKPVVFLRCPQQHVLGIFDKVEDIDPVVQERLKAKQAEIEDTEKITMDGAPEMLRIPDISDSKAN